MREELYKLGFSKTEAAVYLVLLNLGTALPSTLSRLSGLKRPTAYAALDRLEARNLVYSFKKGPLKYFAIDDPNKILIQEQEKFDAAKHLIDMINTSIKTPPASIDIAYYEGAEGYRRMYEDILETKPAMVSAWTNLDGLLKGIDPKRETEWTKERIKNKIFARLLVQETEETKKMKRKDSKLFREIRFLPKDRFFESTCLIYDGKVTLFETKEETICICIKNPYFHQMFANLFEITWNQFPEQ